MVKEISDFNIFLEVLKDNNISSNPFLSYEYISNLATKIIPKKFICFVVENEEKSVVGLLPLEKALGYWRIYGYRASNYLGVISQDGHEIEVLDEIEEYITHNHKSMVICLYDINSSSKEYEMLHSEKKYKEVFLYACPAVDVNRPFDELFREKVNSSKKRAELKKFQKKMGLIGNVRMINITDQETFDDNRELVHQLFDVHRERFHTIYPPDDFCFYSNEAYYTQLLYSLACNGDALISVLCIDNVVVSFLVTLVQREVIVDWMPAFDPAFSKYSVGNVHLKMFLEYLCKNPQYKILDFSKGTGTYKDRWSDFITDNYGYIRGFGNNPLITIRTQIITAFFELKSLMRKKGYLEIIKEKRVNHYNKTHTSNHDYDNSYEIVFLDSKIDTSSDIEKFNYGDIRNAPIEVRKEAVDAIYSGSQVFLKRNDDAVLIQIVRGNGNAN